MRDAHAPLPPFAKGAPKAAQGGTRSPPPTIVLDGGPGHGPREGVDEDAKPT